MAQSKHTQGPVKANFKTAFIRDAYGGAVAVIYGERGHSGIDETSHARIRLITDAFDVLDQTGLTPRQLAEQRAEFLAAAKLALSEAESWIHDQLDGTSALEPALARLAPARTAIANAEGGAS